MTYAIATKYGKLFEIMADPYAIIILDYLFETEDGKSIEELVEVSRTTESKVRDICEKLVRLTVLNKDYRDGEDHYKSINTQNANFLKYVLERID
jgi:hypothetical protein